MSTIFNSDSVRLTAQYRSCILRILYSFTVMSFKNIEYLISQKNKPLLKYDGFLYRKDCENGEVSYWRCAEVEKCSGRINIKI